MTSSATTTTTTTTTTTSDVSSRRRPVVKSRGKLSRGSKSDAESDSGSSSGGGSASEDTEDAVRTDKGARKGDKAGKRGKAVKGDNVATSSDSGCDTPTSGREYDTDAEDSDPGSDWKFEPALPQKRKSTAPKERCSEWTQDELPVILLEYSQPLYSEVEAHILNPDTHPGLITLFGAPGSGRKTLISELSKRNHYQWLKISCTRGSKLVNTDIQCLPTWFSKLLEYWSINRHACTPGNPLDVDKIDFERLVGSDLGHDFQSTHHGDCQFLLHFEAIDLLFEQIPEKVVNLLQMLKGIIVKLNHSGISVIATGTNKLRLPTLKKTFGYVFDASAIVSDASIDDVDKILSIYAKQAKKNPCQQAIFASQLRGPIFLTCFFLHRFLCGNEIQSSEACLLDTQREAIRRYRSCEATSSLDKTFMAEFSTILSDPLIAQELTLRGFMYTIKRVENPRAYNEVMSYGMKLNKSGLINVAFDGDNEDVLIAYDPCPCALEAIRHLSAYPTYNCEAALMCATKNVKGQSFETRFSTEIALLYTPIQKVLHANTPYECDINTRPEVGTYLPTFILNKVPLNSRSPSISNDNSCVAESFDILSVAVSRALLPNESPPPEPRVLVVCQVTSLTGNKKLQIKAKGFFKLWACLRISVIVRFVSENAFKFSDDAEIMMYIHGLSPTNVPAEIADKVDYTKYMSFDIECGPLVFSCARTLLCSLSFRRSAKDNENLVDDAIGREEQSTLPQKRRPEPNLENLQRLKKAFYEGTQQCWFLRLHEQTIKNPLAKISDYPRCYCLLMHPDVSRRSVGDVEG
ncbi:hypothetical protein Pelo_6898 [Pelomyxa schiedti]|nr:hypothetical protein Pelo_6898 [Pelomyxa schiedti]